MAEGMPIAAIKPPRMRASCCHVIAPPILTPPSRCAPQKCGRRPSPDRYRLPARFRLPAQRATACIVLPSAPHKPEGRGPAPGFPADEIDVLPGDLHRVVAALWNKHGVVRPFVVSLTQPDEPVACAAKPSSRLPHERGNRERFVGDHLAGNAVYLPVLRSAACRSAVRPAAVIGKPLLPRRKTGSIHPVFQIIVVRVHARAPASAAPARAERADELLCAARGPAKRHAPDIPLRIVLIVEVHRDSSLPRYGSSTSLHSAASSRASSAW